MLLNLLIRMHEYNTNRKESLLKEYRRNIQKLVSHIGTLEDKVARTQYAHAILKLMGTLSAHGKDNIEYTRKRWDDLFIISDYTLDIDSDYIMPSRDALVKQPQRLAYCKTPLKYRHYGRHIELLVKKATEIADPAEQEHAIISIAKLIKNFSSPWNKDNLDTHTLLSTIADMADGRLNVNWEKIKVENNFRVLSSGTHRSKYKSYKKTRGSQLTK